MKMQMTKSMVFGLITLITLGTVSTSCNKDDDEPSNAKANIKITVSVTGADSNDQVDFGIGAGNHDASQYGSPVWKINGVVQGNEDDIIMGIDDFTGSTQTYVFETVKPFNFGNLNAHVTNHDGGPVSVSYKTEVGGALETDVTTTVVAGQTHNKNYTYMAK
ncbi:MAG: hypothetical protein LBE92_01185 [Chryseobacterium sp.]|jgi:hypothetical protein|uniref:hypothetical protein n=1 Tax=Chryseobacterium sp. TaxID=1871047 RepID=UPI002827022D|nr:hypothetical protein [Chryseobacterium sp.]MDR2234712.1 hypothetical protein [Chryseobacterium sp.]